jgi:hypothetical protein
MPNGTYGGVRGEAGDDLTYSILKIGFFTIPGNIPGSVRIV